LLCRVLLAVFVTLFAAGSVSATTRFAYRVTPETQKGDLDGLRVEIVFRGGKQGALLLHLAGERGQAAAQGRHLRAFQIEGGRLSRDQPDQVTLNFAPGARVRLSYIVGSAYDRDPASTDGNPVVGPVIRPRWFFATGSELFLTPVTEPDATATFAWGRMPRGWRADSDLAFLPRPRGGAISDLQQSTIIGGQDVDVLSRSTPYGVVRLAIRGRWRFAPEGLLDDLARIAAIEPPSWGERPGSYFMSLIPLAASPGDSFVGGLAEGDGFAMAATEDMDQPAIRRVMAHERMHEWIPGQLGRAPAGQQQRSVFWISEGFTDYLTDLILLESKIWSAEQFADHVNDELFAYNLSPVRAAPNERIVTDFRTSDDVHELPYQRGFLLALTWDSQLRALSHDRVSFSDVLRTARDRYRSAPSDAKPELEANLASAFQSAGLDIGPDVAKHIVIGEPITMPAMTIARCIRITIQDEPTSRAGRVVGVRPDGPAYEAGLRDGMVLESRDGGRPGDAMTPVRYHAKTADGRSITLQYTPKGGGMVPVARATPVPSSREGCEK
jgi:predicted metalloprotease with PDZ domain